MGDGEHTNLVLDYGFNLRGDDKRKRMGNNVRKEGRVGRGKKKVIGLTCVWTDGVF